MATLTVDTEKMTLLGKNCKVALVDGLLVFVVDPSKNYGKQKLDSKMELVGMSGGFKELPPDGELSANIYVGK